jgi:hypothetical protein
MTPYLWQFDKKLFITTGLNLPKAFGTAKQIRAYGSTKPSINDNGVPANNRSPTFCLGGEYCQSFAFYDYFFSIDRLGI